MRWQMWGVGFVFGLGLAALAPGCVGGGAGGGCPPGAEGCACLPPNLCATGLSCVSGFCVNLGGPEGGATGDNGDGDTGDGDGTTTGDGDGTTTGDGDGDGVNLCQLLIDCIKEVQPESLSSYVALYGPDGECYDIAGLTQEDCWAECDAIRETLAMAHPDAAACGPPNCGDGKLDLDEMCDGTDGCTQTCRYSTVPINDNECSPVTQVGCDPASERCSLSFGEWENSFYCSGNSQNADGSTPRSGDCFGSGDCQDSNAVCVSRPDCVDYGCCTLTCYLGPTDEDFTDCPAGYTCTPVTELFNYSSWPDGSELVGVCW